MEHEYFDVLIVGAGLSGIGAAYRLQTECPGKTYAVLEGRDSIGGTWDLFKYPGIRSDSDMFTLGYPFRLWPEKAAIADGASILNYIRDTAAEFSIDKHIRYRQRVVSAAWSSASARWTVEVESDGSRHAYSCNFLYVCSGYYSYQGGYTPEFPGRKEFGGRIVHPQQWPEDLDYVGRRVVVIGSGATAVTLVPAMAKDAAHVTMLQRSPTYVSAAPSADRMGDAFRRLLSPSRAATAIRWRNLAFGALLYQFTRRFPDRARQLLRSLTEKQLSGSSVAVDPHFNPSYNPWDQRVCLAPDGDLFQVLKSGDASIVTDRIATFTKTGIALESGEHLDADVIVTATGLKMVAAGEVAFTVDGERVDLTEKIVYKGLMISDVPNLAWCIGYTNASWTLRADLSSRYVCRLLRHMDEHGHDYAAPTTGGRVFERRPVLGLTSGYIQRAADILPQQSDHAPWLVRQNYFLDFNTMRRSDVTQNMHFGVRKREMSGASS